MTRKSALLLQTLQTSSYAACSPPILTYVWSFHHIRGRPTLIKYSPTSKNALHRCDDDWGNQYFSRNPYPNRFSCTCCVFVHTGLATCALGESCLAADMTHRSSWHAPEYAYSQHCYGREWSSCYIIRSKRACNQRRKHGYNRLGNRVHHHGTLPFTISVADQKKNNHTMISLVSK